MGEEVNVTDWIEDVEELKWCEGVWVFKVEEEYITHEKKNHLIRGLSIETSDNVCYCKDYDDVLLTNSAALSGFLINNVKIYKRKRYEYSLKLKDVNVLLTGIID